MTVARAPIVGALIGIGLCLAVLHGPPEGDYPDLHWPLIGFMGWDGGVHRQWQRGDSYIAPYGGDVTWWFGIGWLAMLTACAVAAQGAFDRPRMVRSAFHRRRVALGLAAPFALLAMIAAVLLYDLAGLWDGWFVRHHGLVHRVRW